MKYIGLAVLTWRHTLSCGRQFLCGNYHQRSQVPCAKGLTVHSPYHWPLNQAYNVSQSHCMTLALKAQCHLVTALLQHYSDDTFLHSLSHTYVMSHVGRHIHHHCPLCHLSHNWRMCKSHPKVSEGAVEPTCTTHLTKTGTVIDTWMGAVTL